MAKSPRVPSWDEMNQQSTPPTNKNSNLPTYDEIVFKRQVEQRADRNQEDSGSWDVTVPKDIQDANEAELDSIGSEQMVAPTSNAKRPRALTIGYNADTRTLIVVFRDNTWWQYNDVPAHMWIGLRNSGSTGEFLRAEGLDQWPDMGPANPDALSAGVRAQISYSASMARGIQNSKESMSKLFNLKSFTAEEIFKDYL